MDLSQYIRRKSPTEIQYNIISLEYQLTLVFPPPEIDHYVIEFLRHCPKDLIQFKNPIGYYELSNRIGMNNPFDLRVIYDKNVEWILPELRESMQVKLFFLDYNSTLIHKTIELLRSIHQPWHVYHPFNLKKTTEIPLENVIREPSDFIYLIIDKQDAIFKSVGMAGFQINPSISIAHKDFSKFHYFIPTRNNYFTMNCLIGNFATKNNSYKTDTDIEALTLEEQTTALKNKNSFQRQSLFLKQLENLDFFPYVALKEKLFKLVQDIEPQYPPLILIAPFNNPDIANLIPDNAPKEVKEYISELAFEQMENYTSDTKIKNKPEEAFASIRHTAKILQYLDDIGFLHASNNFSPVIRLPIKGKTIYRELSFFRTSAFAHMGNLKNRRTLQKTIEKFSDAYIKGCISLPLQRAIKERNSQIVLVSDLPLEWLSIDKVPLAFTNDVCRLPVVSYSGLMSNFASNNVFQFKIPNDILKDTLVIIGSNEPRFQFWRTQCEELSKTKGFKVVLCNSIAEVEAAIKNHKPKLLVFDCHGSYDAKTNSTFLYIGKEKLTGEIIAKRNITAPLVFLSACGTAPTYGAINTIANAFFGTGCFSVTTTYLPVEINGSSILYLRLLNKLDVASVQGMHKNWLEYVSHIIRTSYFTEKYQQAIRKSSGVIVEKLTQKNIEAIAYSLSFFNRRKIFSMVGEDIFKVSGIDPKSFVKIIPEYLFYSNLGRGDLVYFETWHAEHQKLNELEQPK